MIALQEFVRKNSNISERKFLGRLLSLLTPPIRISTIEWAETYRILTSEESFITGKFDCDRIPSMEYIYDCLDNKYIYIVVVMKASQVGWSELTNNYLGKLIHTAPCKIQWVFPGREPSRIYSREKLKPFFDNTKVLRDIINIGVAKESFNYFKFPGGFLKLTTAGAISNAKTSSISHIGVEEPDDVKDDVKGQGDTLDLYKGRQKSFPIGYKKLLFGGTPTDKDFSRVDNAYSESNKLVFKAECHHCKELSELSTDNIHYLEYADRFIHEEYGKDDPETAYYACPHCNGHWTFEEKNQNIRAGKKYGFTDFTGNFSKGWHPSRPEITETFGFQVPELLSTLSNSDFVAIARKKILAERAKAKGNEGLMKSFVNNTDGKAYASGITALEVEDMIKLRRNYPENISPPEGLVLTAGVDVQDNRFAIIIRAWGRRDCSWLVKWTEIFGKVQLQEWDEDNQCYKGVWGELTQMLLLTPIMHSSGKEMYISAISIDSADNTELVYNWVLYANQLLADRGRSAQVFAVKGVRDLRYSEDPIYAEPSLLEAERDRQVRKSLAETKGVTLFNLGAHRAHEEILQRIVRNTIPEARSNIHYFNEQSYGGYEAQILSCRKIIDTNSSYNRSVYKLIPGKRKESIDGEKLALHASFAIGVRNYTTSHWYELEKYYHDL